jgi:hypothetical protein
MNYVDRTTFRNLTLTVMATVLAVGLHWHTVLNLVAWHIAPWVPSLLLNYDMSFVEGLFAMFTLRNTVGCYQLVAFMYLIWSIAGAVAVWSGFRLLPVKAASALFIAVLIFTFVLPAPLMGIGKSRPNIPAATDLVANGNLSLLAPLRLGETDLLMQFEPYRNEYYDREIGVKPLATYSAFQSGLIWLALMFAAAATASGLLTPENKDP